MAVPDYQSFMLPLLKHVADGETHSLRAVIECLADEFGLSVDERRELIPSGKQTLLVNRASWARTYLSKAGLLEAPARGSIRITGRGREVLAGNPASLRTKDLHEYPEFAVFKERGRPRRSGRTLGLDESDAEPTPEEALQAAYQTLRGDLASELLDHINRSTPAFFERLVVDLIVSMGYGGSRREASEVLGRSGDEGIDGIIKEDRLGLDIIYVQAKRWQSVVGRPEIQKFAGALQGQRARKGIFITTSEFTREAVDYVSHIETKIILIDGGGLVEYMIDYGVGVATVDTYEVKRVDSDYFEEG